MPEQVLHLTSQLPSGIGSLIFTGVSISLEAIGFPAGLNISILKLLVSPGVPGFFNRPTFTPNCPEFVVSGKIPSTLIVVFPLPLVSTVHVNPAEAVKIFPQVFSFVAPPVFVAETVISVGSVMSTYEFFGTSVSAVKITL